MSHPSLFDRVESALSKIRPRIQAHGGDIEVVSIDEPAKTLTVRLSGACCGCPASILTLKIGVERVVFREVPEIEHVEAV